MKFKDYITPVIDRDYDKLEDALDAVKKLAEQKGSQGWGMVTFCVTDRDNLERLPDVEYQYYNFKDEVLIKEDAEDGYDYSMVVVTYPDETLQDKLYPLYEGGLEWRYSLHYFGENNSNEQITKAFSDYNQCLEEKRYYPVWNHLDLK